MLPRGIVALMMAAVVAGCSQFTYQQAKVGKFSGTVDVRWIRPDRFIFVPNSADPMQYVTAGNRVIRPSIMYTDGGSIPRLFWSLPGYSPWGYAPAYIVHDWVFHAHSCAIPEYADITFDQSASLLADGVKTLMEDGTAPKDSTTLTAIYEAVKSPIAKQIWDTSPCVTPPTATFGLEPPGELLFQIKVK